MIETEQTIPAPDEREKGFRLRFGILKLFFLLFFGAVAFRLVQVQVVDAGTYREIARRQYEQKFTLPAERGNIYDRSGNVLVSNTKFVSFAADPKIILADEPTSALDDTNTDAVLQLLRRQAERTGAALLIVTHDQRLKDHMSERVELAPLT